VLGEERNARQSLGWSHFVRHGMVAWIETCVQTSPEPIVANHERIENAPVWPPSEVVSVMAGMALGCILEVAR
jgi:hypothetical protein